MDVDASMLTINLESTSLYVVPNNVEQCCVLLGKWPFFFEVIL